MHKKNKVLIKDFGEILEEFWEVDNKTIDKFSDSKGVLYATSIFENGLKKYHFLKKYLWDAQEELEDIYSRPYVPDIIKKELANKVIERKRLEQNDSSEAATNILPRKITDIVDNIDLYLKAMRKDEDKIDLPKKLNNYIWSFFRDVNPDKEKLRSLAIFLADHTYRYSAYATQVDDYTRLYFASVMTELWDAIQARGVDTFYILDNELREDRFLLAMQLFALSGVAVVTPYVVKGNYHKYMTIEEQAKWVLSFVSKDFDPKKYTMTIDGGGDDIRGMNVIDLLKEYMKHSRNIAYIEKDDSVNYLEEVQQLAKESKYMSVLRNKAPDDPNVTVF